MADFEEYYLRAKDELDELRAENERLKSELEKIKREISSLTSSNEHWKSCDAGRKLYIEELREELKKRTESLNIALEGNRILDEHRAQLQQELATLRSQQAAVPTPEMLEAVWRHRKINGGTDDTYEQVVKDAFSVEYKVAMRAAAPQPSQQAEPVAWLSIDCIGERYLCFSKPIDKDTVYALYTSPTE